MARNDPDGGAPTLAAPVGLSDMNEIWKGDAPERCLVRIIDIEEFRTRDGPELRASFRDPGEAVKLPPGGIEEAIREAARNAGPKRRWAGRVRHALVRAKAFFTGPVRSPLDIELYGPPTFIVFILARPVNLRFSPAVKALSHKNPADSGGYGGLTHVSLAGDEFCQSAAPREDCRIVYFVAEPPTTPSDPPPRPPGYWYKHGLSLNVRLHHPPDDDGDRTPRALDIMIDPDIRYPGQ